MPENLRSQMFEKREDNPMYNANNYNALEGLANDSVMMHFCTPAADAENEIDRKLTRSAEQYDVPFEGQTLKAYAWGEGKTILMVHGWGSRASHLAFLGRSIAKSGFRVIAFMVPPMEILNLTGIILVQACLNSVERFFISRTILARFMVLWAILSVERLRPLPPAARQIYPDTGWRLKNWF